MITYILSPLEDKGGSRDDPESERGAVPGVRVVTGFLDVDPDIWAGRHTVVERRKAPSTSRRRTALRSPYFGGKEKRTKGWPGTSFTGQRSVGSAGYLTIESDSTRNPDERAARNPDRPIIRHAPPDFVSLIRATRQF